MALHFYPLSNTLSNTLSDILSNTLSNTLSNMNILFNTLTPGAGMVAAVRSSILAAVEPRVYAELRDGRS